MPCDRERANGCVRAYGRVLITGWAEKAEKVQGKGLPTSVGGRVGAGGGEASWCGVGRCGHDVCAHAHATRCVADEAREEALGCCVLCGCDGGICGVCGGTAGRVCDQRWCRPVCFHWAELLEWWAGPCDFSVNGATTHSVGLPHRARGHGSERGCTRPLGKRRRSCGPRARWPWARQPRFVVRQRRRPPPLVRAVDDAERHWRQRGGRYAHLR